MPPHAFTHFISMAKGFLRKGHLDKFRAINATTKQILFPYGFRQRRFRGSLSDSAETIRRHLQLLAVIERERYTKELLSDPIYNDKRRLPAYGLKVYSQSDEDGIIQEIFTRIGQTSRIFVEFGVDAGLENNTLKLLLEGWRGLWLEGSEHNVVRIIEKFRDVIRQGRLQVQHAFVDRENINGIIGRYFRGEIDLLSIDVDGNDIYLLEVLDVINPRVIVIEYNAKFPPPLSIAQVYKADHRWRGTDYTGASLSAVTKIAELKGYALVGCGIVGVNAFFVRKDLLEDKFFHSHAAEDHYQPPRYFLLPSFIAGHAPDWGPYDII